MTVKDLINMLQDMPQDADVYVEVSGIPAIASEGVDDIFENIDGNVCIQGF